MNDLLLILGGRADGSKGASFGGKVLAIFGVLILLIVAFGVYQIYILSGEVASLQQQNSYQQFQLQNLQGQLSVLASKITSSQTTSQAAYALTPLTACLSVTPDCVFQNGTRYVYVIDVQNSGSLPFPIGSNVFLSFKDGSGLTYFGFNTTLSLALAPSSVVSLSDTSWPPYADAASKLRPGDVVGIGIVIANVQTGIGATVLTCNTTTTTFVNVTRTQTSTFRNCG